MTSPQRTAVLWAHRFGMSAAREAGESVAALPDWDYQPISYRLPPKNQRTTSCICSGSMGCDECAGAELRPQPCFASRIFQWAAKLGTSDRHAKDTTTLEAAFRCHTWLHAVGMPSRKTRPRKYAPQNWFTKAKSLETEAGV